MSNTIEFILSTAKKEQFPKLANEHGQILPEIAFVGRSNVGKSSLINHLTGKKNLARVSSTPGKTQLINFFSIHDSFVLVDLPGWGYAKVPKVQRQKWGELTESYLSDRSSLQLIVHLIDLRHPPTKDDIAFAKWANYFKKPLLIVFTKADKLTKNELMQQMQKNLQFLKQQLDETPIAQIPYSIKNANGKQELKKILNKVVKWD